MGMNSNLPSTLEADIDAIAAQIGVDNPTTADQTTVMNFLKSVSDKSPVGANGLTAREMRHMAMPINPSACFLGTQASMSLRTLMALGMISSGDSSASYPPSKTIDDDDATYWCSLLAGSACNGAAYIGTDFKTPVVITSFTYTNGSASFAPTSVKSQYSDDLVTWVDIATHAVGNGADAVYTFNISHATPHRAYRLLANSNLSSGYEWRMVVMDFIGYPAYNYLLNYLPKNTVHSVNFAKPYPPTGGITQVDILGSAKRTSTFQAGSTTSEVVLDASSSATADYYNGMTILFTSGLCRGQVRTITDYDATTKHAILNAPVYAAPLTGDGFAIYVTIAADVEPGYDCNAISAQSYASIGILARYEKGTSTTAFMGMPVINMTNTRTTKITPEVSVSTTSNVTLASLTGPGKLKGLFGRFSGSTGCDFILTIDGKVQNSLFTLDGPTTVGAYPTFFIPMEFEFASTLTLVANPSADTSDGVYQVVYET